MAIHDKIEGIIYSYPILNLIAYVVWNGPVGDIDENFYSEPNLGSFTKSKDSKNKHASYERHWISHCVRIIATIKKDFF